MPVAIIGFIFSGSLLLRSEARHDSSPSGHLRRALEGIVSKKTARTIEKDAVLRKNFLTVIDAAAGATSWLAERYSSEDFRQANEILNDYVRELGVGSGSSEVESRSLVQRKDNPLASFANALSNVASAAAGAVGLPTPGSKQDDSGAPSGGGTNPLSAMGDLIKSGLSGIANDALKDVASAGMFLGIGAGEGAASGLNLTTAENARAVGAKVAAANKMEATGLKPAIENVAMGATSTLLGAVDFKSLAGGVSIGPAAQGLAKGVGNGLVKGLNINPNVPGPNPNATGVPDIAEAFGFGLTDTVSSNINVNALANSPQAAGLITQIPPAVRSLAEGLGSGAVAGLKINPAVTPPNGTSVPDIANNFGFGLSNSVTSNINIGALANSGATAALITQIPPAALSLARGLGTGAVSGLKINTAVAPPNGTSIPDIAGNVGFGLSDSFLSNINAGAIAGPAVTALLPLLNPAALALSKGLGNGAVSGLKLNANIQPPNGSSIPEIAGTVGFGLSQSVTSNIDTGALMGGAAVAQLMAVLPPAALGFAQGLGNGAVTGLKLNSVPPPSGSSIPDIAGSIGYGLSQSVTSNTDYTKLSTDVNATDLIIRFVPQAASGLGRGLGEGIPVGLGIQPDPGVVPASMVPNGALDISAVAQNFGLGLTSRLLANGTSSKLLEMAMSSGVFSGLLGGVSLGKAVGGLARGFLQGVQDGITAMGGMDAIVNGKSVRPSGTILDTPVNFDDTVGGAATGFGQGFGAQGVITVEALFNHIGANTVPSKLKRGLFDPLESRHIVARQLSETVPATILTATPIPSTGRTGAATTDPTAGLGSSIGSSVMNGLGSVNLTALLDADIISRIMQKAIDILTGEGIGGTALVGLGLIDSGTIPVDGQSIKNLAQLAPILPANPIYFHNEGNAFQINLQALVSQLPDGVVKAADNIEVNGTKVTVFAAFVAIHIILGIVGFLFVLPIAMSLEAVRNMALRVRKPNVLVKEKLLNNVNWLGLMGPSVILTVVFGVLIAGDQPHFRNAHAIIGIINILVGLIAVLLHIVVRTLGAAPGLAIVRSLTNNLFLVLSHISVLTGFQELSKLTLRGTHLVSLELALLLGLIIFSTFAIGSFLATVDAIWGMRHKGAPVHIGADGGENMISKENIHTIRKI